VGRASPVHTVEYPITRTGTYEHCCITVQILAHAGITEHDAVNSTLPVLVLVYTSIILQYLYEYFINTPGCTAFPLPKAQVIVGCKFLQDNAGSPSICLPRAGDLILDKLLVKQTGLCRDNWAFPPFCFSSSQEAQDHGLSVVSGLRKALQGGRCRE
jgi:hypothetical protein